MVCPDFIPEPGGSIGFEFDIGKGERSFKVGDTISINVTPTESEEIVFSMVIPDGVDENGRPAIRDLMIDISDDGLGAQGISPEEPLTLKYLIPDSIIQGRAYSIVSDSILFFVRSYGDPSRTHIQNVTYQLKINKVYLSET